MNDFTDHEVTVIFNALRKYQDNLSPDSLQYAGEYQDLALVLDKMYPIALYANEAKTEHLKSFSLGGK
jgi:hypothetical protein